MAKREVKSKGMFPLSRLAEYLEEMAAGFSSGAVIIQSGAEKLTLEPAPVVKVKVEVKKKDDEEKIELEISWKKEPPASGLKITQVTAVLLGG